MIADYETACAMTVKKVKLDRNGPLGTDHPT